MVWKETRDDCLPVNQVCCIWNRAINLYQVTNCLNKLELLAVGRGNFQEIQQKKYWLLELQKIAPISHLLQSMQKMPSVHWTLIFD